MILYSNGDSHAAGAEINDLRHVPATEFDYLTPHPDNIAHSYGYLLAKKLNLEFATDAQNGASNDRILRTTRDFINNNSHKDIFVLIGWSTTDRKEVKIDNEYYSFSPGYRVPNNKNSVLNAEFKKYILALDHQAVTDQNNLWHKQIYKFHQELSNSNIPHLFFNTFSIFNESGKLDHEKIHYNWDHNMIGPYHKHETYYWWIKDQGYNTVSKNSYHYGADAHQRWADFLYNWLTDHQLL